VHFKVNAPLVITEDVKELAADAGEDQVQLLEERAKEGVTEFVGQLDPETKIKSGEATELGVDTSRLHFFDPETSRGIYGNGG
jgi:multiple sugar transport system ATP-binding protein